MERLARDLAERVTRDERLSVLTARELAGDAPGRWKVSLRATEDTVDVSRIARAQNGGGHRQAAGFTTRTAPDELVAFLRREVAAQLDG